MVVFAPIKSLQNASTKLKLLLLCEAFILFSMGRIGFFISKFERTPYTSIERVFKLLKISSLFRVFSFIYCHSKCNTSKSCYKCHDFLMRLFFSAIVFHVTKKKSTFFSNRDPILKLYVLCIAIWLWKLMMELKYVRLSAPPWTRWENQSQHKIADEDEHWKHLT